MPTYTYISTCKSEYKPRKQWDKVEIEYGYFFAWMVAASFMFLAFLVFVSGYRSYRKLPPAADEEPVVRLFVQALKQGSSFAHGKLAILGWSLIPVFILVSIVNAFAESPTLKIASAIVAVVCIGSLVIAHLNNKAFLPKGDVSDCLDCVPLLLVGNLFFGILQSTIASVFQSQASGFLLKGLNLSYRKRDL